MPDDTSKAGNSPFARFAEIRSKSRELKTGKAFFLAADRDVLVILRFNDDRAFYTAVNRSDEDREFEIIFRNNEKRACIPAQSVLFFHSL